jgi:hypothetical protein
LRSPDPSHVQRALTIGHLDTRPNAVKLRAPSLGFVLRTESAIHTGVHDECRARANHKTQKIAPRGSAVKLSAHSLGFVLRTEHAIDTVVPHASHPGADRKNRKIAACQLPVCQLSVEKDGASQLRPEEQRTTDN